MRREFFNRKFIIIVSGIVFSGSSNMAGCRLGWNITQPLGSHTREVQDRVVEGGGDARGKSFKLQVNERRFIKCNSWKTNYFRHMVTIWRAEMTGLHKGREATTASGVCSLPWSKNDIYLVSYLGWFVQIHHVCFISLFNNILQDLWSSAKPL